MLFVYMSWRHVCMLTWKLTQALHACLHGCLGDDVQPHQLVGQTPDHCPVVVLFLVCRYELAYIESRAAGVARGQRVWQLAFGSGFKFNSCVLVANKRVQEAHTAWKGFEPEVRGAGRLTAPASCQLWSLVCPWSVGAVAA